MNENYYLYNLSLKEVLLDFFNTNEKLQSIKKMFEVISTIIASFIVVFTLYYGFTKVGSSVVYFSTATEISIPIVNDLILLLIGIEFSLVSLFLMKKYLLK